MKIFQSKTIIKNVSLFSIFLIWVYVLINYYMIQNWLIWTLYLFLANGSIVIIWKTLSKWFRGLKNKKEIGKKLELFFFIFLFLSSYFLCFIIVKFSLILMSNLFSISVISAIFCGWLHYWEEISKPESSSSWKHEYILSQSNYIIFVTIYFSVLSGLFSYCFFIR